MNQPHTPNSSEATSAQMMSEAAWHRALVLNSPGLTGEEAEGKKKKPGVPATPGVPGLKWEPNQTEQSGDYPHDSIFHDRHEPHFKKYVTDGLGLSPEATDEDIAHAMELQDKATGVISAQPHEYAKFIVAREAQAREEQAARDAGATLQG